jgi:hypothetical protein
MSDIRSIETLVPQFETFKEEGAVIGRLLTGYGTMEVSLASCVAMAVGDLDMTIKAMFRARGETQRIDIADAIGRKPYERHKLGTLFAEAIGGMRYCLRIRNQFAHGRWHDPLVGRLCFVDMEEIATKNEVINDYLGLTLRYVTVPLLKQHEEYFLYIENQILYLNYEGRKRAGEFPSHARVNPKKLVRPPLYIP